MMSVNFRFHIVPLIRERADGWGRGGGEVGHKLITPYANALIQKMNIRSNKLVFINIAQL